MKKLKINFEALFLVSCILLSGLFYIDYFGYIWLFFVLVFHAVIMTLAIKLNKFVDVHKKDYNFYLNRQYSSFMGLNFVYLAIFFTRRADYKYSPQTDFFIGLAGFLIFLSILYFEYKMRKFKTLD
ncbi:hypothetical protein K2P97_12570 [bacterium]|nr:hypothetical protein [bacterium]